MVSHAARQLKQTNFTECGMKQSNQQCTGISQNNDQDSGRKTDDVYMNNLLTTSIATASGTNLQKKCNYTSFKDLNDHQSFQIINMYATNFIQTLLQNRP